MRRGTVIVMLLCWVPACEGARFDRADMAGFEGDAQATASDGSALEGQDTAPDSPAPDSAASDAGSRPTPSLGQCPEGECDLVAQTGCGPGEACDLYDADGEPARVRCRVAGPAAAESPCSSPLDCAAGLTCRDSVTGPKCSPMCCARDSTHCPGGYACQVRLSIPTSDEERLHACDPRCDPLDASSCPPRLSCYPFSLGESLCWSVGAGAEGATCTFTFDCMAGHACTGAGCRRLCRVGGGEPSCPEGRACLALGGFGETGTCD